MRNLKPRLMVLTDIGGDPDDEQSLVRLLMYSNAFEIVGIVPELWAGHKGRHGVLTPEHPDYVELALGLRTPLSGPRYAAASE